MTYLELEKQINNLIAKDEIEAAIALLSQYYQNNERLKAIVLQSGRFHALKKDQINGVIDYATVQQYLNQLRSNILDFVKSQQGVPLPEDKPGNSATGGEVDIKSQYRASLARAAVLLILKQGHDGREGMTITEIHKAAQLKGRKYIVGALQEMEENDWAEKNKIGRMSFWKLSEEGSKLAREFGQSLEAIIGRT